MRRYESGELIYYHDDETCEQFVPATVMNDGGGDFVSIFGSPGSILRDKIYPDGAHKKWMAALKEDDERELLAGAEVAIEDMLESHKAPVIHVWRFTDAPQVLQEMSDNGGDEDWVALVPKEMADADGGYIGWLESSSFGCCCINEHEWGDYRVYIGCHA